MRSYTANFLAAIALTHGADLRLLLEISASTTLYYSDKSVTVGAQEYIPQVEQFNRIQGGRTSISLSNIPRINDKIKAGQTVNIYMWDANTTASDKGLIYSGIIGEGITGNKYTLRFTCTSKGDFFDKKIGSVFDDTTYPTADPDVYGNMIPIIIGSNRNVKCSPIESGMLTTLSLDITDVYTTALEITEHSRGGLTFTTSGGAASTRTVIIGDEEIIYTTAEKDDTPRLLTLTRGANGTTATSHSAGDAVIEKVTSLKYKIADHDLKAVTKPRILPFNSSDDETVQIDSSDYSVDLPNGEITLTNIVGIRRQVNYAITQQPDQPITTQPNQPITTQPNQPITTQPDFNVSPSAHKHTTTAVMVKTLYGTSASGFTNSSNAIDGNENSGADAEITISNSTDTLTVDFDTDNLGTIQDAFLHVMTAPGAGFVADYYAVIADLDGFDQWIYFDGGSAVGSPEWFRLNFNEIDSWSELDNLKIRFKATTDVPTSFYVHGVYWEIHYIPSMSNKTLASNISINAISNRTTNAVSNRITNAVSNRITDAAIGGDSVSDTLGGPLIVNVDGKPDDVSGTYTGTPSLLIEKLPHVNHWLLKTYGNSVTDGDIDLAGSYQDAEDNLPASYKIARWITKRQNLNFLLDDLAPQAFCRHEWSLLGLSELIRLKNTGTAIREIDTDTALLSGNINQDNRIEQVQFTKPTLRDIANDINIKYYHNPNLGNIDNEDAYEGSVEDTDANSIIDFGNRQNTWRMSAIGNNTTMGQSVLDNYLLHYARGHQGVSFPVDMSQLELEPGDLIDIRSLGIGLITELHDIIKIDYDLISLKDKKHLIMWINALNVNLQTLTPETGATVTSGVNPIVLISGILFTPAAGAAITSGVNPTVLLIGSALVLPSPGAAITSGVNPTVFLDSMTITPSPGAAITSGVDPIILLRITPSSGAAITSGVNPVIIEGSLILSPEIGAAITSGVDPLVTINQIDFYDNFEESGDTELSLHPPNIGDGWSELISDSGIELTVDGAEDRLKGTPGNDVGVLYQTDNTIGSPDYDTSVILAVQPDGGGGQNRFILAARIQDADNMYAIRFNRNSFSLYKLVSGSWSSLGGAGISPIGTGVGKKFTLRTNGTSIKVLINSVEELSVTDSAHSAAGKAGIGMGAIIEPSDDVEANDRMKDFSVVDIFYQSIVITPSSGAAITSGVNPFVVEPSVTIAPAAGAAITSGVNPTVSISGQEDLTTYTEVDSNNHITVTDARSTFTDLSRNESAYLYKDFGVDYFSDFEIRATIKATAIDNNGDALVLGMSNTIDDRVDWAAGLRLIFWKTVGGDFQLIMDEVGGDYDIFTYSLGVAYYVTFKRVGTTLTLEIYSDLNRTILLDTLSIAVVATEYRYLYPTSSSNYGSTQAASGYTEDVSIISP